MSQPRKGAGGGAYFAGLSQFFLFLCLPLAQPQLVFIVILKNYIYVFLTQVLCHIQ